MRQQIGGIGRRRFLALSGAAATWASLVIMRKEPPCRSSDILCPESPGPFASRLKAFRDGLGEIGYVEGRNVAIDYQWAEGHYARLPSLAADLVSRKVDVIVAPGGAPTALAAKASCSDQDDHLRDGRRPGQARRGGLLSRPGGNITGVSSLSVELSPKRLELMHELLPTAAILRRGRQPDQPDGGLAAEGSPRRGRDPGGPAADLQCKQRNGVRADRRGRAPGRRAVSSSPRTRTSHFAASSWPRWPRSTGVPAITQSRDFPDAGGLMSYGGDFVQSHRRAGMYAGRVLNGEKPSDLAGPAGHQGRAGRQHQGRQDPRAGIFIVPHRRRRRGDRVIAPPRTEAWMASSLRCHALTTIPPVVSTT